MEELQSNDKKILWSSVWYEWAWRSDFAVIYCSSMLGRGMQQDRWLWPQFWKCSGGFHLALGKAASCRSQYWFFSLPPNFPAEGPIMSIPEATGNASGGGLQKTFLLWLGDWLSGLKIVGKRVRTPQLEQDEGSWLLPGYSRSLQLLKSQFSHL